MSYDPRVNLADVVEGYAAVCNRSIHPMHNPRAEAMHRRAQQSEGLLMREVDRYARTMTEATGALSKLRNQLRIAHISRDGARADARHYKLMLATWNSNRWTGACVTILVAAAIIVVALVGRW